MKKQNNPIDSPSAKNGDGILAQAEEPVPQILEIQPADLVQLDGAVRPGWVMGRCQPQVSLNPDWALDRCPPALDFHSRSLDHKISRRR